MHIEILITSGGLKSCGMCPDYAIDPEPFRHMKKYCLFVFVYKRILALPFGRRDLGVTVKSRHGKVMENNLMQV